MWRDGALWRDGVSPYSVKDGVSPYSEKDGVSPYSGKDGASTDGEDVPCGRTGTGSAGL